jgi:RNA polymerase sigma-70 factor (ECF subfamily)
MGSDSISDAEYVRRIQRGETETFEILVRRHEKVIFNLLYRMLGDYDDAAETAQEVFLSAYRAIRQFRGDANFSTWLYRIALNHATTRRKSTISRRQRLVPIEGADLVDHVDVGPAESLEKKEIRERVQRALNELDPEDAMVILLRDLQDIAYEDIARVLKVPVGTVKSRLHRARQALKTRLAAFVFAGKKAV